MPEPIFFSILVPVYNVERYLPDCVNSVLSQNYANYELILVDDGSTDNSGRLCDRYHLQLPQILSVHKPNGGLMSARRAAIASAHGDYFIFLDSDDMLLPNALHTLCAAITRSNADCLIYGIRREGPEGVFHFSNSPSVCNRLITDRLELLRIVLSDPAYNSLCRKCVRKSCFDGRDFSPWFSVSRGEDLIQSSEILENASSFWFLPEELYFYRATDNSVTQKVNLYAYRADFAAKRFTLDWLHRLDLFKKEDYDRFRDRLLDELVTELKRICRRSPDKSQRDKALTCILKDSFYQEFLAAGYHAKKITPRAILNRIALSLFTARQFELLSLLCTRIYRAG